MSAAAADRVGKGGEIVRCLGYRHFHQDDSIDLDGIIGDIIRAAMGAAQHSADRSDDVGLVDHVDLWHLRSLAIQPGGLLLSSGRKSGWIKLAGVDELVFNKQNQHESGSAVGKLSSCDRSYEEIQRQLGQEMEPSLWHIQRERRRMRKNERRSFPSNFSSTLSQASSMTDLSSYGGSTSGGGGTSGSSTPLTCNLNSRSGTPKSVSFGVAEKIAVHVGAPFTAFATKNYRDMSSVSSAGFHMRFANTNKIQSSFDEEAVEHGSTIDPSPLPSPLLMPSPAIPVLPQSLNQFPHPNCRILKTNNPYIPYQSNTQAHHKPFKARAKKDKRPKERKLLVQIASSAFYLIEQKGECSDGAAVVKLSYYPGMQDLIAIILLHLESPSLASLLFRQIIESHLAMYCIEFEEEVKTEVVNTGMNRSDSEASFRSCKSESDHDDDDNSSNCPESGSLRKRWDLLSLSFFPVLKLVDEELYSSLTAQGLLNNRVFVFAEVLKKWMSSWFCSQEDLPLEVVSRIIDFFLASHPSMPLYFSIAIVCHPFNRDKFLLPSLEPSPTALSEPDIFNLTSEDDAESSHDEAEIVQSPQISHRKPSSPRDRHISKMLENFFTDLTEELSFVSHPNPYSADVINDSLDEKTSTDSIVTFVEDAIITATYFMKQVPPNSLNSLVREYNDGFLLNYLDPRERARSFTPLPWALRSTAPTDHNLSRKGAAADTCAPSKVFSMPKILNEKHQIALDASGLDLTQHSHFGWCNMPGNKMTTLKVGVIIALCIGATLLNLNSMQLNDPPLLPKNEEPIHIKNANAFSNASNKKSLSDFKDDANKATPNERASHKKALLSDFKNDDGAVASNILLTPKHSFEFKPILLAKNTEEIANSQSPKPDHVKLQGLKEHVTVKKKDTPAKERAKKKQQPSIIRAVKNIIRAAICAIKNKSGMRCEFAEIDDEDIVISSLHWE